MMSIFKNLVLKTLSLSVRFYLEQFITAQWTRVLKTLILRSKGKHYPQRVYEPENVSFEKIEARKLKLVGSSQTSKKGK